MSLRQLPLFPEEKQQLVEAVFPSTRYQGSKRKLLGWIWDNIRELPFDTVLDVFGGTGAVSHLFKRAGKQVTYNDLLKFNWNIGLALIENSAEHLTLDDVAQVLGTHSDVPYPDFIQKMFADIYFTHEENAWLDRVVFNIRHRLENPFKQAIAWFALYQACIAKRPYNLFHRANLYMREAQVSRSFGNKTTWDKSFEAHFLAFVEEANQAVFENGRKNRALNLDALDTPVGADLVYIDPPYLNAKGVGVDYHGFYHFLEGMTMYDHWGEHIDFNSRNRRLKPISSPWAKPETVFSAFEALIERHRRSILVVSYRDDGLPSKEHLIALLATYKSKVYDAKQAQKYALSHKASHELLLIAT